MVVFTYTKYNNDSKILSERAIGRFLAKVVEIGHSTDGAPFIVGSELKISISHSGEYFVIAVSVHNVGIDIERMLPRNIDRLSKRFFPNRAITDAEEFYRAWTAMEAEYKCGERFEPRYFDVFENCKLAVCSIDRDISFIPLETFD